eukprot:CAMPEP_0204163322 /NCGR_PEP_ID=MMETSP0361-20130328/36290_1 /ASSEMBLY_ACC=CAM_ASM_000343 /TAXON_ID=268821 /ORGANISM="Scrippsiella Hangoei, Strain SHTV-5" /LENGTH=150 /DNA_ID=CAMNT_0051120013 /DNA_START=58 /DNA_END=506 /DNA_ORIENTATION=-
MQVQVGADVANRLVVADEALPTAALQKAQAFAHEVLGRQGVEENGRIGRCCVPLHDLPRVCQVDEVPDRNRGVDRRRRLWVGGRTFHALDGGQNVGTDVGGLGPARLHDPVPEHSEGERVCATHLLQTSVQLEDPHDVEALHLLRTQGGA